MGKAWWSQVSQEDIDRGRKQKFRGHPQGVAKPVIVQADLQMVEKAAIVAACEARGIGLVVPGKCDSKGRQIKVSLVKLAEQVGVEGRFFRSKREGARYIELRLIEKGGKIRKLDPQPRFKLHVVNPAGLKVHITEYTADFAYDEWVEADAGGLFESEARWAHVVEESKGGFPTKDWELRRKWVEAEYGITIRVT